MSLVGVAVASGQDFLRWRGPEGAVVLHDNIADQWGGHTFSYVLSGERALFWSGVAHKKSPDDVPVALIGQAPIPGTPGTPRVIEIPMPAADIIGVNQPQLLRTPDGYVHVFVGVTHSTDDPSYNAGRNRYFRSSQPEDISRLEDRTGLVASSPYRDYHLRMNVAVSPDGARMALAILAISPDGSVRFNTPVLLIGRREGLDFSLGTAVAYAEPMSFFYPQVAATDDGVVLVGQLWHDPKRPVTRLVHVDWRGQVLHAEDLGADADGSYLSYDLRPVDAGNWNTLVLYRCCQRKASDAATHELWEYRPRTRQLTLARSLPCRGAESAIGKWISVTGRSSLLLHNPAMGSLQAWVGDLLGAGDVARVHFSGTDPKSLGNLGSSYLLTPNPLQGSVISPGTILVAQDCHNVNRTNAASGPCSFVLWQIDYEVGGKP